MKHDPIHLLYHGMHSRPMPGCMPLFVLFATLLVGGIIVLFRVSLPDPVLPRGEGMALYQRDDLTRFQVRQHSALPLRLPASVDPVALWPIPEHALPLRPPTALLPPPSRLQPIYARDSFILDDSYLLEFPPPKNPPEQRKETSP